MKVALRLGGLLAFVLWLPMWTCIYLFMHFLVCLYMHAWSVHKQCGLKWKFSFMPYSISCDKRLRCTNALIKTFSLVLLVGQWFSMQCASDIMFCHKNICRHFLTPPMRTWRNAVPVDYRHLSIRVIAKINKSHYVASVGMPHRCTLICVILNVQWQSSSTLLKIELARCSPYKDKTWT